GGHGQQVQIMIAQYRHRPLAQRHDAPERAQRVGAAIHQIAREPQASAGGRGDVRMVGQCIEWRAAALQVSDNPGVRGGGHVAGLLQGICVCRKRRTLCWFSIRMSAPRPSASAARLGTRAVTQGAHLLSMPTLSANWFSMKNPTPSSMPMNTLLPTAPRRVCIKPMGAAIVILTSTVNGYAILRQSATTCRSVCN